MTLTAIPDRLGAGLRKKTTPHTEIWLQNLQTENRT
jgi:hypothetical protein